MNKDNTNMVDSIRRFLIRAVLELSQGVRVKGGKEELREIPENIEESLNNPYINREGVPLAMDIFKPIGEEYEGKELPVIVSIHGGGLVTGDRKISLNLSRELASRGYLVFAIEYRLAPRATVCEQFDDICAGMDYVGRKLVKYNVDFTRVFMTADSAGALLAIYTAAMKHSKKLQDVIGYEPSRMVFKAIGLSCGMFYTNRNDILGQMLSEQFFGDKLYDENFLQYMNPEHPEIVNNLPPTFLVSSRGDFLNNYTVMFEKALRKAGNTTKMLYYPGEHLTHTFNFSKPWLPESKDANDKMLAFFEEQADIARSKSKNISQAKKKIKKIHAEMEDGSFAKQKLWEAVRAANEVSEERLDSIAIVDEHQKYTYRQMFYKWNDYAEVFTALNMTAAGNARIGIPGAMTTDAIMSFYALNMTGASTSMLPYHLVREAKLLFEMIEKEQITDLILTNHQTPLSLLRRLAEEKDKLGIRQIIIFRTPEGDSLKQSKEFDEIVAKTEGMDYMLDLILKYEATGIWKPELEVPDTGIVLHKYSKQQQTCESVEFTNEELNAFAAENISKVGGELLVGHNRMGLSTDLSSTHSLIKQLHMSLLLNNTVVVPYKTGYYKKFYKEIQKFHINNLIVYPELMDSWIENLEGERFRMSSLDTIYVEDIDMTEEKVKKYEEFIQKNKGAAKVRVIYEQSKDFGKNHVHYGKPDKYTEAKGITTQLMPVVPYAPVIAVKQPDKEKNLDSLNYEEGMEQKRAGRIETLKIILPDIFKMMKSGKSDKKDKSNEEDPLMKILSKLFGANSTDYYYED